MDTESFSVVSFHFKILIWIRKMKTTEKLSRTVSTSNIFSFENQFVTRWQEGVREVSDRVILMARQPWNALGCFQKSVILVLVSNGFTTTLFV